MKISICDDDIQELFHISGLVNEYLSYGFNESKTAPISSTWTILRTYPRRALRLPATCLYRIKKCLQRSKAGIYQLFFSRGVLTGGKMACWNIYGLF